MKVIKVKVDSIKIGSKLSCDVIGKNNNILVKKDTVIDKEILDLLTLHGVNETYIYDDSSNVEPQDIKSIVDEIFSKVKSDEFMKKLYEAVVEFRTKNKL